jgi:hypothetical protein
VSESIIVALSTLSLAITIFVTIILVNVAVRHRETAVLRERAGVAIGLTAMHVLGYVSLVVGDALNDLAVFVLYLGMIAALTIPQLYFLYLYLTRRW